MTQPRRRPKTARKLPGQARSRSTVDAIVEAAAHILVRKGYEAFTTNRVAEHAGVSIGSLYQYFPNKEALLSELMRRHTEEIERGVELMTSFAPTVPLADIIRIGVHQNIQSHLVEPELHRVLSEEVPSLGALDWKSAYTDRMSARIRAAFEARRHEIVVPDLDLAVYVVSSAVEAIVHNAVTQRPADLKSGALAAEVTRLLLLYLTGRADPPVATAKHAAE